MNDDIGASEDLVLLCLGSLNVDASCVDRLQSNGIDMYEFDDADEYVQYLLTLNPEDTFVFVWLGFGWNHLVAIFCEFHHVSCIYLSEPIGTTYEPKVHGVFTNGTELFQQILIDARACQLNQSMHLHMFDSQETSTIQDQQGKLVRTIWSQALLQTLILIPAPATNMYREMLDEARRFYRNNATQLAHIDNFEKTYQSNNAINWYSRDSFTYRLVNKALRTQNLAIIFKFRSFIRDVYEQLKMLYREQNLVEQPSSGLQSIIKVYRAMRVSSIEGNRLRCCKSGTILTINSFVSTSLDRTVAMTYLGEDPERDFILEILIDKSMLDVNSSPFADIRTFSPFPDEQEVLLSMGTTLQVQAITMMQKNIVIQVRLCYDEDVEIKELKTFLLKTIIIPGQNESFYINGLMQLLSVTEGQEKFDQLEKIVKPCNQNSLCRVTRTLNQIGNLTPDSLHEMNIGSIFSNTIKDLLQYMQNSTHNAYLSDSIREILSILYECLPRLLLSVGGLGDRDRFQDKDSILQYIMSSIFPSLEQILSLLRVPSSHPLQSMCAFLKASATIWTGQHTSALGYLKTSYGSSDSFISSDQSLFNNLTKIKIAKGIAALGDDDRSLQILQDLCMPSKPNPLILSQLANFYAERGDLSMAITYHRNVIDECHLPPNSLAIVRAYFEIGKLFSKLDDIESTLSNYYQARDLLLQHHEPTHPLLTTLNVYITLAELNQQIQRLFQHSL